MQRKEEKIRKKYFSLMVKIMLEWNEVNDYYAVHRCLLSTTFCSTAHHAAMLSQQQQTPAHAVPTTK